MLKNAIFRGLLVTSYCFHFSTAYADYLNSLEACRSERDGVRRLACFDSIEIPSTAGRRAATEGGERTNNPSLPVSFSLGRFDVEREGITTFARIRFSPTFANRSNRDVAAITFNLRITNAFGQTIVTARDDLSIIIPAGKVVNSPKYYFWDKNPANEKDFDALVGPVSTGMAKATVQIERVAFTDGIVVNY